MFKKILIANRGEIACRVIKTAQNMGIETVAVYSEADRRSLHVRMADEAVCIGSPASSESYLKGDNIIRVALDCGAQAIHPGYGFLSENAAFARACTKAGIVFIGPSAETISAMGLKDCAKDIMNKAGVPVVPGYQGDNQDIEFLAKKADETGYPVLIKAVAGGGGKGLRLVERKSDFIEELDACKREAKSSFGNDNVLIEKYLTNPRHIEVQIFGDTHGNVVHLFERDCSLQRRHQKVVEEAPAPNISDSFRDCICAAAVCAARAIDYCNAGTVEFIVQGEEFYFMEMNTRLQVEHPVTEMITGQDLVEWQLRVAAGEALPLKQDDLSINGHAFEVRIYAEDPSQEFLPQTGRINHFSYPDKTRYMRVDTGVAAGDIVSMYYDPMVAKLVSWGESRTGAVQKMVELLAHTHMCGLTSNQEFISNIFAQSAFIDAEVSTGFIAQYEADLVPEVYGRAGKEEISIAALYYILGLGYQSSNENPWNKHDNWRIGTDAFRRSIRFVNKGEVIEINAVCFGKKLKIDGIGDVVFKTYCDDVISADIDGELVSIPVIAHKNGMTIFYQGRVVEMQIFIPESDDDDKGSGSVIAPMTGSIAKIMVRVGDAVEKGQTLLVIESMKVHINIAANCDGIVGGVFVEVAAQVSDGALLVNISPKRDS